jgi:Protein of unknown function (DUF2924)
MPRVKVGAAAGSDQRPIEIEVARLRDLDLGELRARWHTVFGRRAPSSLPRHLLFRVLAYRAQADALGRSCSSRRNGSLIEKTLIRFVLRQARDL